MFKPIFDVLTDSGVLAAMQQRSPLDPILNETKAEHAPPSEDQSTG